MKASILLGWSEAKTHGEGATDPRSKEPDGGDQRRLARCVLDRGFEALCVEGRHTWIRPRPWVAYQMENASIAS
jgi:hypothetical protein